VQDQPSEFRGRLEETFGLRGLSTDLATEIESRLTQVTYERGAVIFARDSSADFHFWLLKGLVKLYLPHRDGTRTLLDLARPGELLGFVNCMDSTSCRQLLQAEAVTKCSVGLFTVQHMKQALAGIDHETAICALVQLNTAWSKLFERYASFIGASFRTRIELVLTRLGDRFGVEDERGILLTLELSHEDLAEMIGCSRPMVGKLMSDLTAEGLLEHGENRHLILRKNGLPLTAPPEARTPSVMRNAGSQGDASARAYSPTVRTGVNPQELSRSRSNSSRPMI
jgi:CRP/FNR family transcriptional regulator, cyclic AMP receptor protein